ncbi:MAG: hypothetical protein Q4A29_04895 [Eubacteriales bacterium]|nr:hypothetical protein [Eubacteriales bacterium]
MDKATIKNLIEKLNHDERMDLIMRMASLSETAQNVLLDFCMQNEKNKKSANYILIVEQRLMQYWREAESIIAEFDCYGGGCEGEEEIAYDLLEQMIELIENNTLPWPVRKSLLDDIIDWIYSDNSGFSDYLIDLIFLLCVKKQEKKYMADLLSKARNSYYKDMAANTYLEIGEDEKFLQIREENLEYASDFVQLAKYYQRKKDEKKVLEIAQNGLKKCQYAKDELYEFLYKYYNKTKDEISLAKLYKDSLKENNDRMVELMYRHYKKAGNYSEKKAALLRLFYHGKNQDVLKLYKECRNELTKDDFIKEEPGIINVIKKISLSVYFDILLEKDQTEEILNYLMENGISMFNWTLDTGKYCDKLANKHPREIVEIYWNEVEKNLRITDQMYYARTTAVLKKIKKIMQKQKWLDEWEERYQKLRETHKKKRLLLSMLKDL